MLKDFAQVSPFALFTGRHADTAPLSPRLMLMVIVILPNIVLLLHSLMNQW